MEQALDEEGNLIGVVISKLESHRGGALRGYIAMLAVKQEHRGKAIATNLVRMALDIMIERDAEEVCTIITSWPLTPTHVDRSRLPLKPKSPTLQP